MLATEEFIYPEHHFGLVSEMAEQTTFEDYLGMESEADSQSRIPTSSGKASSPPRTSKKWGGEEDDILRRVYPEKYGNDTLKELLPHRTMGAIYHRAIHLNLHKKPPISKDELYDLYWVRELSLPKIEKVTGIPRNTIRHWMIKHNVPRRTLSASLMGHTLSKESRRKISEAKKGKPSGRKGKRASAETRRKQSESIRGEKHWFYGRKHSEETKRKIALSHIGKPRSEETKRKMSEGLKGKYAGEKSPHWKGGISFEPYPILFTKELKEKIRERDGYNCKLCGKTKDENGKNLSVHHINYCKDDLEETNLISLCNACNAKVNYNRDYWTKYFQDKMKKWEGEE